MSAHYVLNGQTVAKSTIEVAFAKFLQVLQSSYASDKWSNRLSQLLYPPTDRELLHQRISTIRTLANQTLGLLARQNDYKFSLIADLLEFAALGRSGFNTEALAIAVSAIEKSKPLLAHAVSIPPQLNERQVGKSRGFSAIQVGDEYQITGRATVSTMAPLADYLLFVPFGKFDSAVKDHAFSCLIPVNSSGVSVTVHAKKDQNCSRIDGFSEPDAILELDSVMVPSNNFFFAESPDLANGLNSCGYKWATLATALRYLERINTMGSLACAIIQTRQHRTRRNLLALGEILKLLRALETTADSICDLRRENSKVIQVSQEAIYSLLLDLQAAEATIRRLVLSLGGSSLFMRGSAVDIDSKEKSLLSQTDEFELGDIDISCWELLFSPVASRLQWLDLHAHGDPEYFLERIVEFTPWDNLMERASETISRICRN